MTCYLLAPPGRSYIVHVVLTVGGEKAEVIRVTDSKEPEENEDEDDLGDDDEKRKKKKTRTVFSRSQVRVAGDGEVAVNRR